MKSALELIFACVAEDEARALGAALGPDSNSVPRDQTFSSAVEGRYLRFRISSPRASSCIASALGILADAKLFQDVWTLTA